MHDGVAVRVVERARDLDRFRNRSSNGSRPFASRVASVSPSSTLAPESRSGP
jgi:hypothetical protein